MVKVAALAFALSLGLGYAARAAEYSSVYTKLDLALCREEGPTPEEPMDGMVVWCEGHDGIPVRVAEGDLRMFVSYGNNAAREPAASETVPPFNTLGPAIEWRLKPGSDGKLHPFATILRFLTDADGVKGSTLVVTRLGPPVCHVGYVDAVLNPDANVIARLIADDWAENFVCGESQPVLGEEVAQGE